MSNGSFGENNPAEKRMYANMYSNILEAMENLL